jgi:predicted dehydrogenase
VLVHRGEILIGGLGSMGRRHLANLRSLGWERIALFRTGRSTLRDDAELAGLPVVRDLDAALARQPIAVVVANPTSLHVPLALAAARAGVHLLIEKPLSHTLDGVDELAAAVEANGLTALVGFHFRFNPGLQAIARAIADGTLGTIVSAHVHWGESLPDMHPWEDYRSGYAARASLGGGVLNTLSHPFDYLRWLLGDVAGVSAIESLEPSLGLAVDVDTCVDTTLWLACGAEATVHLDFLQRPRDHRLVIVGTGGTVAWNDRHYDRNAMFIAEMAHFLACIRGDARPCCTLRDGRAALETVLSAKRAIAGRPAAALASAS